MKTLFLTVFLSLIPQSSWAISDLRGDGIAGVAYHTSFGLQYTVPLTEAATAASGCKYTITTEDFLNAFQTKKPDARLAMHYKHHDSKSMIIIKYDIIWLPYFISSRGIVRHGDKYYRINKKKFEKALTLVGCPSSVLYDKTLYMEFSYPRKLRLWVVGADENAINFHGGAVFSKIRKIGRETRIQFDAEVSLEINSVRITSNGDGIDINDDKVENSTYISIDENGTVSHDKYIINFQCSDEIGALCNLQPPLDDCGFDSESSCPRVCAPP